MLSRALNLATVAFVFGCLAAIPASAQNLEAGKSPSQIFSSTCSLCHKSPRGLLKSGSPGSLPGFLRQHYTTSSDMASAMSAYVLSNGAANAPAGDNLTRQGQEAKSGPKPSAATSEPKPDRAARGNKPAREATRPDVDGLDDIPGAPQEAARPAEDSKPMTPAAKRKAAREAAREAAKQKAAKGKPPSTEPPKVDARHEAPKEAPKEEPKADPKADEAAKTEAAKSEATKTEGAKTEGAKSDAAKAEGTRPDPVPAVTPAPKEPEKLPESPPEKAADAAAIAAPAKPVDDNPDRPLTIDVGPAPAPPPAAVPSGAAAAPAGPPIPPVSQ